MTYSASRLTLYALLSAVESDLREMLVCYLGSEKDIPKIMGPELFDKTFERYLKDGGDSSGVTSITDLVDFLDFADAYQLLNSNRHLLPTKIADQIQDATPLLDNLVPVRNRVAHSRPLNFEDFDTVIDTTDELSRKLTSEWSNLSETKKRISQNPGSVLSQTIPDPPQEEITHNLPIPDFDETGFFGQTPSS